MSMKMLTATIAITKTYAYQGAPKRAKMITATIPRAMSEIGLVMRWGLRFDIWFIPRTPFSTRTGAPGVHHPYPLSRRASRAILAPPRGLYSGDTLEGSGEQVI